MPDIHKLVSSGYYKDTLHSMISVRDEETGVSEPFSSFCSDENQQSSSVASGSGNSFDFRSLMATAAEKEEDGEEMMKAKHGNGGGGGSVGKGGRRREEDEKKPSVQRQFSFRTVLDVHGSSSDSSDSDDDDGGGGGDKDDNEAMDSGGGDDDDGKKTPSWDELGLDKRIIAATRKLGFTQPSQVQHMAIPLALQQRDIIAKAATGTGKTAAYAIPAIQMLLEEKLRQDHEMMSVASGNTSSNDGGARVLCIVPSHELAAQVHREFDRILKVCRSHIVCYYLGSISESNVLEDRYLQRQAQQRENSAKKRKKTENKVSIAAKSAAMLRTQQLMALKPHIIIGTPAQILRMMEHGEVHDLRTSLRLVIIDEADLVLGSQFQMIQQIVTVHLPRNFQCIMMSATLRPKGLSALKGYLVKNHVELNCVDSQGTLFEHFVHLGGSSQLQDSKLERILLTNYIIRYKCKNGKVLIFVNDIQDGFILYFCLRKLGVSGCMFLSPDYPMLSKYHIMDRFNSPGGKINVLITMDTVFASQDEKSASEIEEMASRMSKRADMRQKIIAQYRDAVIGETEKASKEEMFNMARGIDFKKVAAVINYNVPRSPSDYVHRVGRAGRGGKTGLAITILDDEQESTQRWNKIVAYQKRNNKSLTLYDEIVYDNIDRLVYRFQEVYDEIVNTLHKKMRASLARELANAKALKRHGLGSKKVKHHDSTSTTLDQKLPSYLEIRSEQVDSRLADTSLLDEKRSIEAKERKKNRKFLELIKQRKKFEEEDMMDSDEDDNMHEEETENKLVTRKKVKTAISRSHDIDPLRALAVKTRSNRGMRKVLEKIAKPTKVSKHIQKVRTARHIQRQLVRSAQQAQWADKGAI